MGKKFRLRCFTLNVRHPSLPPSPVVAVRWLMLLLLSVRVLLLLLRSIALWDLAFETDVKFVAFSLVLSSGASAVEMAWWTGR